MIALLKKGLRVLAPELKFENPTCRYIKRKMLKEAVRTKKSYDLNMFVGTEQGDEQALEFVQEVLNLKAVQIDDEKMKTKESNQNVGPADDWSKVVEGIENCVKFPSSTPNEVVEFYRKLDLQRRELERQRTHVLKYLLETSKPDEKVVDEVADEIAGDKQRNVAEGQEVWEAATSIVTARATCGATFMVAAETTLIVVEEALMPYDFYSNNFFVSTGLNEDAGKNLLDKEIEMIRQMMMKEFWKKPVAVKQRRSSRRKTAEYCESAASGERQHKVWRPGEEQQTEAAANGKLQQNIWDPGKPRSEHMIRRS